MPNPFGTTFESLESPSGSVVESIHEVPYRRLVELIDSGEGQLISLRAPRAGYGKTMLLSRLREKKKSSMTIIPIHLADGRRVEGERVLEEILTQLAESVPGAAGLTKLDLHTRRLFAHGLLPMVYSGEVPSQDKEGALSSLRERPTEAFDFHNEGAAIAQWTKSQYEVLAPRLSSVLGKASGVSTRDTSYWMTRLFEFAIRTPNEPSRTGDLMDSVFGRDSRFRSGAGFLDGLGAFLNLITLVEPAVLVLDEVDGLSSDSDSALRATSCLISLWESAPRMSVIISVNDDVWDSAFAPRLPLGLRDRLEDIVIRLKPLTPDEARALVKGRAGDDSTRILSQLDLESDSLYPRGVLKAARAAWDEPVSAPKSEAEETAARPVEAAAVKAAPVEAAPVAVTPTEVKSVEFSPEEAKPVESTKEAESPLQDFSAPSVFQPASKIEEPVAQEAPAKPKTSYPPLVVRRVAIPRAFDVVRIREVTPTVPDFSAPAAFSQPPALPETTAPPAMPQPAELVPPPAPQASPFEVAPSQAAQVAQAAVPPAPASPFEVAPVQAAPVPVQASPFSVAPAPAAAPSPFGVAPTPAAQPPVEASPFEAAPPVASPFHGAGAGLAAPETQSQSILPPARPVQSSPFEASQAPPAAPEIAPQAAAPVEGGQENDERRSGRVYPSKSPFDAEFPSAGPSPIPPGPPVQAPPAPPVFAAPSPFEANLAPQALPPQPEVPKADTDAIDDLLRQFREHRDR